MDPRIAIVIITRDRADDLERTLSRLRRLPERPPVAAPPQLQRDRAATREAIADSLVSDSEWLDAPMRQADIA